MWTTKRSITIAVLVVLPVFVLMLVGELYTEAKGSNGHPDGSENVVNEMLEGMQPQMPLEEVAEILGIEVQELEAALTQAHSEIVDSGFMAPLLARMAEILGIDQQTLEDAFAQAQSKILEQNAE